MMLLNGYHTTNPARLDSVYPSQFPRKVNWPPIVVQTTRCFARGTSISPLKLWKADKRLGKSQPAPVLRVFMPPALDCGIPQGYCESNVSLFCRTFYILSKFFLGWTTCLHLTTLIFTIPCPTGSTVVSYSFICFAYLLVASYYF